jgi:hypothetical protein
VNTREYSPEFPYCSKRGILQPQDRKKLPVPKQESLSHITKEKTPSLENIQKYIVMKGIFPSLRVLVNKNTGIS